MRVRAVARGRRTEPRSRWRRRRRAACELRGERARDAGEVDDRRSAASAARRSRWRAARARGSRRRRCAAGPERRWRGRGARARRARPSSERSSATIDLAAALVGDAVLVAEVVQPADALDAQPRLQRAGLVVDAGVGDAGVRAGLVHADAVLALEHDDPGVRVAALELARGRQADDAGADDREVAVAAGDRSRNDRVMNVLVTGATGFVGAALIPAPAGGAGTPCARSRDGPTRSPPGVEVVAGRRGRRDRARRGARRASTAPTT